jgi:hypothetical protein
MDRSSNPLGRAETVISPAFLRVLCGTLFYVGLAVRIACRLCWMVAWSFVLGVTLDGDVHP